MARYNLKFKDISDYTKKYINVEYIKSTVKPEFIQIIIGETDGHDCLQHIWLDKSTAIKLAKTLRTEINKIQD